MNESSLLTLLTFTPLLGAMVVAFCDRPALARAVAMAFSVVALVLAGLVWNAFDATNPGMQLQQQFDWIPSLGVQYKVGVDGIGLLMVLLSALIVPFGLLASWKVADKPHLFFALMLFLQAGLFGTFTALNFFHWFLFWELSLIPAYFLIKLWGGVDRVTAATQFFVYTMVGSVTMLLGFVALYLATNSFDFVRLGEIAAAAPGGLTSSLAAGVGWGGSPAFLAGLVFGGIFLGFAIKVPMFPFHTWQPAAYAAAPTGLTMVLTGALSKMGLYGFLRILLPIFPEQMRVVITPLLWLAVATIVFSALAALAQRDLKRMIAYSSMNHLGYCLLGIFAAVRLTANTPAAGFEKAAALNGVLLQMFNHGIVAGAVFCFIAFLEQRASGRRGLEDFGGLRRVAPVFCGLMGIALFALLGLPGLNGFVGEFLIFKGAFSLSQWATTLSVAGLLITAVFVLTILQRVFHGPLPAQWAAFPDLTLGERLTVIPAIGLMFVLGIYPQIFLGFLNPTVLNLVKRLSQ